MAHEEDLRREEQISSSRCHGVRQKSTASPRMTGLRRSSSQNSSRSNSTSSTSHGNNTRTSISSSSSSSSNTLSIGNMINHGSEGSVSSAYSASEASTPSVFSPGPDYYYCNSSSGYSPATTYAAVSPALGSISGGIGDGYGMMVDGANSLYAPPAASYRSNSNKNTPRASRVSKARTSPSPRPLSASVSSSTPLAASAPPAPLAPSPLPAILQKKNKTVWIIRTLEPRKTTSGRSNGGDDYDDYEPQRVQTHVETHIAP